MIVYLKLAWRNIWRNWRRTLIAVAAVVISLVLLLFTQGLIDSFEQTIYGNLIRLYGGNVMIHAPGYREKSSRLPMLPIANADAVLQEIRTHPNVIAASPRIQTGGLVINRSKSQPVNITAIEPEIETAVSLAAENIIAGRFLAPEDGDNIVIGYELARHLGVTINDRVTLIGRREDGSMRGRTMTVVGVFDLGLGEVEKSMVFMNLPTAQVLYNLRDQATEIAVSLEEVGQERAFVNEMAPRFPNLEVDTIFTLRPEFGEAINIDRMMYLIIGGIMLLMAGIGILNLMLMAVYERTREMGVLGALGMKGREVMGLFLLEGASIGLVGAIIGGFASWLLMLIVGNVGIDFSFAQDFGEIYALMGDRIYPHITGQVIVIYGLVAVITGTLGALFPAWQASKQEPAESLHHL